MYIYAATRWGDFETRRKNLSLGILCTILWLQRIFLKCQMAFENWISWNYDGVR